MKKVILFYLVTILFMNLCKAQNLVNAYSKTGKIFVQFDNGSTKEIVSTGDNTYVAISRAKKFVIYKRIEQKSKTEGQEGEQSYDQLSIHLFNLQTNKDNILFTTCFDGHGGTKPDYANSSIYPFSNLCSLESALLN